MSDDVIIKIKDRNDDEEKGIDELNSGSPEKEEISESEKDVHLEIVEKVALVENGKCAENHEENVKSKVLKSVCFIIRWFSD